MRLDVMAINHNKTLHRTYPDSVASVFHIYSYSSSCGLLSVGHLIGQLFNVPWKIFIYLALSILPDILVTANL